MKKATVLTPIYVTRSVRLPLSESELLARMTELPLVHEQSDRLDEQRKEVMADFKAQAQELESKARQLATDLMRSGDWHDIVSTEGWFWDAKTESWS